MVQRGSLGVPEGKRAALRPGWTEGGVRQGLTQNVPEETVPPTVMSDVSM